MADQQQDGGEILTLSDRGRLWLMIGIVLAIIGMGLSAYSINHHRTVKAMGSSDAPCNINETISCDDIVRSEYSQLGSLPLGVLGFGYFAGMAVLAGIGLAGLRSSREHVQAYIVLVGVGVVVSIALALISTLIIKKACLICIGVYVVTGLQALATLAFKSGVPRGFDVKSAFSGATTAAIAVAIASAGYTYVVPPVQVIGSTTDTAKPVAPPPKQDIPISRSAYAGLGEDYRRGPDDAKITIVEFADFQCPACKAMDGTITQLLQEFDGKVQVVFRNYPLDMECNSGVKSKMHEHACKAAIMARCAGQYGKYWDYYHRLFDKQKDINEDNLKSWAKEFGLTDEQINGCWNSPDLLAKVKDDAELGNKVGVDATPSLYINGTKVVAGRGLPDLRSQLEQLLN